MFFPIPDRSTVKCGLVLKRLGFYALAHRHNDIKVLEDTSTGI